MDLIDLGDEPLTWCDDCEGEALILVDLGASRELSCGHLQMGTDPDEEEVVVTTLHHSMFCRGCDAVTQFRITLHSETREASVELACGHEPRFLRW